MGLVTAETALRERQDYHEVEAVALCTIRPAGTVTLDLNYRMFGRGTASELMHLDQARMIGTSWCNAPIAVFTSSTGSWFR